MNLRASLLISFATCFLFTACSAAKEPIWFKSMNEARDSCFHENFAQAEALERQAASNIKPGENPGFYGGVGIPGSYSGQLASLAGVYAGHERYEKAESLFKQAIALNPETNYQSGLAELYKYQKKFDLASRLYEKEAVRQVKYTDKDGCNYYLASTLFDLGDCYRGLNKTEQAQKAYQESIGFLKNCRKQDKGYLAYKLEKLGNFYFSIQKHDRAKECFEEALEIEQVYNPESASKLQKSLGDVYLAVGDKVRAQEYYLKSINHLISSKEQMRVRKILSGLLKEQGKLAESKAMEESVKKYWGTFSYEDENEEHLGLGIFQ